MTSEYFGPITEFPLIYMAPKASSKEAEPIPHIAVGKFEDMPPPRVLHIDDGKIWRGGQHQVFLLMQRLAEFGIEQQLIAPPKAPLTTRIQAARLPITPITMFGEWDFLASLRIERIARAFKANILHAHTSHAHTLALRAHKWLRGQTLMLSTRRVDFPIGKTFFSRCKYTAQPQHFIAISNGVRKALIEGGVDPNCISLAPSGVPPIDLLPREQVRATMGIPESEIAIVTVGALTDHKGHQWLIKAAPMIFESFPQARIHILGEGELRPVLEQQIKWLGLENKVILHGHIDQARAKMAGFDLYLSSSYLEGLGTAILDAMLATLPVVAAAAGGVTDSVIDGYTGRLCLAGDAQALATTTIKALNEWDASLQMAHTAYARVKTEFSDLAMAEKTFHIYQERLSQKQSFQKANRQQILLYSKTP